MGHIITLGRARRCVVLARGLGDTVVFTNGHFDLLHVGHVDYLQRARGLGDMLIVGLNSDASTRALKGENRPIIPQDERARMLAALACVDYVVQFDEKTAGDLILALMPDIYVKGEDWMGRGLPERLAVLGCGGQIRFIPHTFETSTSSLIEIIVERYGSIR